VKVVVVGATGAVGTEMLGILTERSFPFDELVPVASPRSAGRMLECGGRTWEVKALAPEVFDGADIALFDVPDEVSAEWAPVAAERGAIAVDNSAAFRMDPDVPLVVPEVNPDAIGLRPKGIIASPNCTTLAMVVPISALHRAATVRRMILASYQAASGSGKGGADELIEQMQTAAKEPERAGQGLARELLEPGEMFPHPIAMNVIPRCGSLKDDGYTSEELKLCYETRKIMSLPELPVTATCVRVPVAVGHGVSVHAEFAREITVEEARSILREAPGVELVDEPERDRYPTPLDAAGLDPCFVGRIRRDLFDAKALELFCVADNLRKGAALNTVQVAELLLG
jgi:aspartate-semialdehyde dehydrogenase